MHAEHNPEFKTLFYTVNSLCNSKSCGVTFNFEAIKNDASYWGYWGYTSMKISKTLLAAPIENPDYNSDGNNPPPTQGLIDLSQGCMGSDWEFWLSRQQSKITIEITDGLV